MPKQAIISVLNEIKTLLMKIAETLDHEKSTKKKREIDPFRKAITIHRAAETLDASKFFIYDLIKEGKLETVKILSRTYVTIRSLERLQEPK